LQYEPDTDNPKDLTELNPTEADTLTLEFYPEDPYQPMSIGGLEVGFCTHPSGSMLVCHSHIAILIFPFSGAMTLFFPHMLS
jgi:hypothetical protein